MNAMLSQFSSATIVLISLFIILLAGFLVTRITKKLKLPNVSGYIIAGILIGPGMLDLIPSQTVANMSFVGDIALAFIAFGVGKFFKKEVLRETGVKIIVITLFEALVAGILVSLAMHYVFSLSWSFSLLLGAIATATAPASTMMTINQYHARGKFVNVLLQVVAFDDVVCLLVFSIVAAVISSSATGSFSLLSVLMPILYNIGAIVIGFLCGLILSKLLTPSRSTDNRLILAIALLLGISGLCAIFNVSPLLSCMVFGATYINTTHDKELYRQINNFTPPVMSMFFTISGMSLDIRSLSAFGLVGIGYFAVRIIGKYAGAYLGCAVTKTEKSIKNNLGVALIPQAGVAIGLAFLGQRILPPDIGNLLLTIVLSSSVLYELIGPICAKIALIRSGVITSDMLNRKTVLSSNTTPLPPDASVMPINPLDSIPNKVG